jgi:hypothetical protein
MNQQRFFCFSTAPGAMSTFDPYRYMLRRAYADGTDLRLFVTPLHLLVRAAIDAVGLGERYEFWLKQLVRINEEEAARAGQKPLPLWDFSDANTVTREALPTDTTPMRWFWDPSHYRKATGDLILDRMFDFKDPARPSCGLRRARDRGEHRRSPGAHERGARRMGHQQFRLGGVHHALGCKPDSGSSATCGDMLAILAQREAVAGLSRAGWALR